MADSSDIPDLDLSALSQPDDSASALPAPPTEPTQPSREVVASLRPFHGPLGDSPEPVAVPRRQALPYEQYPAQSQRVPSQAVETIQIAPHPTTNRFPWAPIPNPTIPIPNPAATVPRPQPIIEVPPVPVAQPAPAPQPAPLPVQPPPPAPEPTPKPVPEPVAAPEPPPMPVEPPPPPVIELPDPQPVSPEVVAQLTPPPPAAAPLVPALKPQPDAAQPETKPKVKPNRHHRGHHIYSDYTREVWHVFRPNLMIRLMVLMLILLICGSIVAFWLLSGAPTNILDLPILQPIINAE